MNIDLTQLSKLRREDIKPGHVVKFVENEGEESIPKPSKLWLSMKKYNFKGELLKNYTSIVHIPTRRFTKRASTPEPSQTV